MMHFLVPRPTRLLLGLLLGLAIGATARAQDDSTSTSVPAETQVDPLVAAQARLDDNAASLVTARAALEASPATPDQAARHVQLLERIGLTLDQLVALLRNEVDLKAELEAAKEELTALRTSGPVDEPPYSLKQLESIRDQYRVEQERAAQRDAAIEAARQALAQSRTDLDAKERARRQAREAHDTCTEPARLPEFARALLVAQLESRAATEQHALREVELRVAEKVREVSSTRLSRLEEQLAFVKARTRVTTDDRAEVELELVRRENKIRSELEIAQRSLDYLSSQWMEAKQRLDRAGQQDAELTEEVEAFRVGQIARREQINAANARLERVADMRETWARRYEALSSKVKEDDVATWRRETRNALAQLDLNDKLVAGQLGTVRNDIVTLDGRIETAESPQVARWLREHRAHQGTLVEALEARIGAIEQSRRLYRKLLEDLGPEDQGMDIGRQLKNVWKGVTAAWGYEITTIDDSPITLGKIVKGVLLLIIGVMLSRVVTRMAAKRIFPRLRINEGVGYTLQTLAFYLLVVMFALFALKLVNVPLTAFTILGGALAIGVGFGSQNIVNNFISGLILLGERPIRAGDLVQLDSLFCTVEHIGLRSTRVRSGDNVEIIVPNSSFLEQNVVNWTLSSTRVRTKVVVGVAYGSPTTEVREILVQAVREHAKVHKSPEPIVLFANFGDNSLEFEVHFWVTMRSDMQRRIICSEIRFRIDDLCREQDIVIAFPQRDVHLDTLSPLQVRIEK